MNLKRNSESLRSLKGRSQFVGHDLESLPCSVVRWWPDRSSCVLNVHAKRLLGFSNKDFQSQKDPSFWVKRIHPEDRFRVLTAWKKLAPGEKTISCDYRFFPNTLKKVIWLREVSTSYQNGHGTIEFITSAYTDISDLKADHQNEQKDSRSNVEEVVGGLVHEVQNNLQVINMGFDLVRQGQVSPVDYQQVANYVERTGKSVQELREFFLPPSAQFSKENPGIILQDVVRQMEMELQRQGVRVRLIRPDFLPLVDLDERQFRMMLKRVVEFSRALLPQGGVMEIRSRQRMIRGQRYIELKVTSSSAISLGLNGSDVFRPFLRVNGYHVGLSIELAQQILRRHHGSIIFQKQSPKRGQFTILLRTRSD